MNRIMLLCVKANVDKRVQLPAKPKDEKKQTEPKVRLHHT
jgi:hypothetical protein